MVSRRVVRVVLVGGLACLVAGSALADTIYLKNGRAIHTSKVEEVGDKIVFLVYGAKVAIPKALVERIEKNDATDEVVQTVVPPTPEAVGRDSDAGPPADVEGGDAKEAAEEGEGEALPPEKDPAYWAERIKGIREERTALQETVTALRREERAFLFAHRSTAETREKIELAETRLRELDEELKELRREARRLGVPPGWLRVKG